MDTSGVRSAIEARKRISNLQDSADRESCKPSRDADSLYSEIFILREQIKAAMPFVDQCKEYAELVEVEAGRRRDVERKLAEAVADSERAGITVAAMRSELQEARSELHCMQEQLDTAENDRESLEEDVDNLRPRLNDAEESNQQLVAEMEALTRKLESTQQELSSLTNKYKGATSIRQSCGKWHVDHPNNYSLHDDVESAVTEAAILLCVEIVPSRSEQVEQLEAELALLQSQIQALKDSAELNPYKVAWESRRAVDAAAASLEVAKMKLNVALRQIKEVGSD